MYSLCPQNNDKHRSLIPIPSPKLTALPTTILTSQSLYSHFKKQKIILEKRPFFQEEGVQ